MLPASVTALSQKPPDGVLRDIGRHGVRAFELAIVDVVASLFQRRDDTAAALRTRQNRVAIAMRDENPRLALPGDAVGDEAGRERENRVEEISVRHAEPKPVRRAVRESSDRNAPG